MIDRGRAQEETQRVCRRLLAAEENRQELIQRPVRNNYRKRRMCDLTADELVGIAHARFVEDRDRRDVA